MYTNRINTDGNPVGEINAENVESIRWPICRNSESAR